MKKKKKKKKKCNCTTTGTRTEVYVNVPNRRPKHKTCPEMSARTQLKASNKVGKIIICALALFLLGALSALCAVGILYHNKLVSCEILRVQCDNVSAILMMQEHKNKAKQNSRQCEEGWKNLGLKCYYFSTKKLNWTQSRDYCEVKGGHLVIITSQTEQEFLSSQVGQTHWIGLNDLVTEGKWMWVNKQSLTETGVTFWYDDPKGPKEPDNWKKQDPSGENCAALGDTNGSLHKWFDASCRKIKKCICEK